MSRNRSQIIDNTHSVLFNIEYILENEMANKKAEVKKVNKTMYLELDLYERFFKIAQRNERPVSYYFNKFMKKFVEENENKNQGENQNK